VTRFAVNNLKAVNSMKQLVSSFALRLRRSPAVFVALMTAVGCARSNSWKYEPAPHADIVSIVPADLGVDAKAAQEQGSSPGDEAESQGRFPSAVAVVQVSACMRASDGVRLLHVADTATERKVHWGHAMDQLAPVREVVFMDQYGLDPRGFQHRDLLRSALDAECTLCLIFARVEDTELHAEYVGALWDAAGVRLLATYRVPVLLTPLDVDEQDEMEKDGQLKEKWLYEADFRAEADLRRLVRDDIWDLALRDQPASTRPSPWRTDNPLLPRDRGRWRYLLVPPRPDTP